MSVIEQDLRQIRPFVRRITINEDDEIEFKKTFCFCGTMNVTQATKLISVTEMVIAVIFLVQAPDIIRLNGRYFYFDGTFEGYGLNLFILELVVIASCIFTALLLLIGIRVAKPGLLLPHMIWQALFIVECISSALFLAWLTYSNQLLRPAAVVLIVMIAIPTLIELWWLWVVYRSFRFMLYENQIRRQWRKESQFSKRSIIASGILDIQSFIGESPMHSRMWKL